MDTEAPQAITVRGGRGPLSRLRRVLILGALGALLASAAAVPVLAVSGDATETGRLNSDLVRAAKLNNRGVRPPARRLARELPDDAKRLGELREPAATARDEAGIALDELRQMSAPATLNPHYLPALVAAGRAFLAAGGRDPLTRTAIDPAYAGLEAELALREARLRKAATDAAKLSARARSLSRALARARRRARRLERQLRRERAGTSERARDGVR
jgi:hypothetical protein